ncbi:MAG: hypothetical protein KGH60_02705 [Candidatus Micrarchaeota archaeon]|nr:hypothetical protein [Candidatus Micrarchaeota archaeon]
MLHTERMQKIRILSVDAAKYSLIRELQRLGAIDLRKSELKLGDDSASDMLPRISDRLVKFKSVLSILGEPKKNGISRPKAEAQLEAHELLNRCDSSEVVNEVFKISEERKDLEEHIKSIADALKTAGMFSSMGINFGKLKSSSLGFRAILVGKRYLAAFKDIIESGDIRSELIERELKDGRTVVFIAYDIKQASGVDDAIKGVKCAEINITNKMLDAEPEVLIERLEKERAKAKSRIVEIDAKISAIRGRSYYDVAALTEMLEIEYERANVSSTFKRTSKTFVIEGWAPKKELDKVKLAVAKATDGVYSLEEMKDGELAPTLTRRPRTINPFSYILDFYSVPRSDEIDPTWIFIFSFAIFYGMMVSDVGYGIISLAFATWLAKRSDPEGLMYNVSKIWQLSAVSVIIFGIVSNQFLGYSFAPFNGIKIIDWINGAPMIILATILMGIAQVILGQVFSFVNKLRHHETKLAISKLTAIAAILAGIVAIGGGLFHAFNGTATLVGAGIAVVSLVITGVFSGIEASELTNLITHPLSYTRLMGFGLASVIIASLIDQAFTPTFAHGPLLFIGFLIIFIVLHLMNMVLGIFEGIIQSARLNFVEFFSKFYTGNGIKFRPYYYKRRYTKD